MTVSEIYSLSSDFPSGLNTSQFGDEIIASSITAFFIGTSINGDVVSFLFQTALSGADKTTLDGLVSSYVYVAPTPEPTGEQQFDLTATDPVTQTSYTTVGTIIYPPATLVSTLLSVWTVSNMESGGTSYDVRIYNMTQNNVVCSGNFTNTTLQVCKMNTISNQPAEEDILEIQVKVNGATTAHINNATICYL